VLKKNSKRQLQGYLFARGKEGGSSEKELSDGIGGRKKKSKTKKN